MGLDLSALGKQVRQMSHAAAAGAADTASRAARARERLLAAAGEEAHWASAAELSRETAAWLLARPVEPLDTARDVPPPPPPPPPGGPRRPPGQRPPPRPGPRLPVQNC
ncbi:MAG TPA: hypothetical protein PKD53_15880, partial [Chloroflexaceae bacterium]|nr:hypothetical protein [Chloroflexaceae bacterium]